MPIIRRRPYPTDLCEAEWAALEPLLPPPSRLGRLLKWPRQVMAEAIFYLVRSGCALGRRRLRPTGRMIGSADHGGCCRGTSHLGRPYIRSSADGAATTRCAACTTVCEFSHARRRGATPSRALPSSTALDRAAIKGALHRRRRPRSGLSLSSGQPPAGPGGPRQAHRRPQAAPSRGHLRPHPACARARCRPA